MLRMIFSDIDGTLINSDFVVTAKTKQAIRQAVEQGITFVPVSARMPEAIQPIIDTIGVTTPIISYNGALLQNQAGDTLASSPMLGQEAFTLCRLIEADYPKIAWNIYSFHDWYACNRQNDWVKREEGIVGVTSTEAELDDLADLAFAHKVLLMGDPAEIAPLELTLKAKFSNLSIAKSAPYFIEIMAQGIKKGQAVAQLAELEGVALADTIAFGDNFNDLDMLETVGQGYVMSNGPKEVQEAIGHVTDDHNNDGIAKILLTYLEN